MTKRNDDDVQAEQSKTQRILHDPPKKTRAEILREWVKARREMAEHSFDPVIPDPPGEER